MSTAIGHLAFNQTATKRTDYPLDVAISGDGFFKVQLPNGSVAYTRNGAFGLDSEGRLVTSKGYPLYGNIYLPSNVSVDDVIIGSNGAVSYTYDGATVSTGQSLSLARFLYTSYLQSIGDDLFIANDMTGAEIAIDLTDADETTSLIQGRLDTLNVTVRGTKADNELTNSVKQFVFGDPNTKVVFTQGVLANTGVSTNVALDGEGFFRVILPNGDYAYTRDGSFTRDSDGYFVTADGYRLADQITVPRGALDSTINISSDGTVSYTVDGNTTYVGTITVYRFLNPSGLEPIYAFGENLFLETKNSGYATQTFVGSGGTSIYQGMVERNGVNFVEDFGSRVSIAASDGNDTITNREAMISIDAGNGNDIIQNTNMLSLVDAPVSTLVSTGGLTDLAIDGDGYFKVELPDGDAAYTRNGAFTRDSGGNLVTADGYPLYENVAIPDYISSDTLIINSAGAVTYYQNWGTIPEQSVNVYVFNNPEGLESIGNDLYKATSASGFAAQLDLYASGNRTAIVQGALENHVMRDEPTYLSIVDGGTGNDSIDNVLGDYVWIKGGQGADTIKNSGDLVTISGGSGNDLIYNFVGDATVDGLLKETGRPTSVAIEGDGYFKIKLADGSDSYTRNGDFHIDSAGNLVTADGYALYDNVHIPLRAPRGSIEIARDGTVSYLQNGSRVSGDQIKIYQSADDSFIVQGVAEQFGTLNVDGQGTLTMVDGGEGDDTIVNNSPGATIMGGAGSDRISLQSSAQTVEFSIGGGNDTIYGFDTDDTLRCVMADVNSSSLDGSNVILYIGGGSITFVGSAGKQIKVQDTNGKVTTSLYGREAEQVGDDSLVSADTLAAGIVYNKKRPKVVQINSPYSGLVDEANFSYRVTKLDASNDDQPVVLVAAANRDSNLIAGTGGATLIGNTGDDKLYGNVGSDVFVYSVGGGNDLIGIQKRGQESLCCAAQDKIVLVGNESLSSDSLILTDRRKLVTVEFEGDKNSRLTINKTASLDAVQFYFGTDYVSALEGDPYTYGVTSDVSLNARGNVLTVKPTTSKTVTIDASDMVSTARTIDGSSAKGKLYLIGNGQSNVMIASAAGSTLDGGWNKAKNRGTADKYYGGSGADVYIYDGAGNDVIYNYEAQDKIVMSAGEISSGRLNGQNVTFKSGSNSLIVRDAKGKTITLTDGTGETSRYQFTSANRTLEKALLTSSDQFSTEDYWFEEDAAAEVDELSEIISAPELDASDLSTEVAPNDLLKNITVSARRVTRHRSEK